MSSFKDFIATLAEHPVPFAGSVTASYILFYTAYDKSKKTLVAGNLFDLALARRGWDWTLVELNKAISLSALTVMISSFLPQFVEKKRELLWISMNMLWAHSVYSFYKFYQLDVGKVLNEKWMKKTSVVLGTAGQVVLSLGYFGYIDYNALVLGATTLSIAHFWTMEVDFKYKLQVRPFAYLPFPLAGLALYNFFANNRK